MTNENPALNFDPRVTCQNCGYTFNSFTINPHCSKCGKHVFKSKLKPSGFNYGHRPKPRSDHDQTRR